MISDFHCLPTLISSRCLWQILDCVNVNDADWQKIQELFAKERQWMTSQMQMHIREVNSMFADERKKVRERYKEYDGCYLGHYAQWFFWFFCVLGMVIFGLIIFLWLDAHHHWTK